VDVNADKVALINAGTAPIVEPEIADFIAKARASGTLHATTSSAEGIRNSDVSFICVGTPSHANGSLDLTHLQRVCKDIGLALRDKTTAHTVVFRSTTLPGTTEDIAVPILEEHSGKRVGAGLGVCYNPEFLREGTSVHDYFNPPTIVVGERGPGEGDVVEAIYAGIEAPVIRTTIRAAEMGMGATGDATDLYQQAVQIVMRDKKASTSYIQRRLQIGYNRAASMMERMEHEGIVGQANHAGKREILVGEQEHERY
jgi:GDP-mannose 6-dehydrogenase